MEPQVTVIIPTYNRRRMLAEAVASVLAQRGVALELVVVDDGSTDDTWHDLHHGELAQMLNAAPASCRVVTKYVEHRGPAAARNRGVAAAQALYIAFLDSDDLWAPNKLERQLAYMQAHPEYLLSQTQESWIRGGRRVNPGLRHKKLAGDIFETSLRTCLVSPSAVMMRVELFHVRGLRFVAADPGPPSRWSARRAVGHPPRWASRSALGHRSGAGPLPDQGPAQAAVRPRLDRIQSNRGGRGAGRKVRYLCQWTFAPQPPRRERILLCNRRARAGLAGWRPGAVRRILEFGLAQSTDGSGGSVNEDPGYRAAIGAWAAEHHIPQAATERWAAMDETDALAILAAARELRLHTGQLLSALEMLADIGVRERIGAAAILARPELRAPLAGRGSRPERASALIEKLRELPYPRLSQTRARLEAAVGAMRLPRGLAVVLPKDLSSDEVMIRLTVRTPAELDNLLAALHKRKEELSALFEVLGGSDEI